MSRLNTQYGTANIKRAGVIFERNACPFQRGKPQIAVAGGTCLCSVSRISQASARVLVEHSHAFYGDHYAP
jgi:hypothetical protein